MKEYLKTSQARQHSVIPQLQLQPTIHYDQAIVATVKHLNLSKMPCVTNSNVLRKKRQL